jgi:DNA topoisomerase-2
LVHAIAFAQGRAAAGADGEEEAEEGEGEEAAVVSLGASYNYLLSMPIYSLTWEKVTALQEEASECASRVSYLSATSAAVMWSEDLDAFLVVSEWAGGRCTGCRIPGLQHPGNCSR